MTLNKKCACLIPLRVLGIVGNYSIFVKELLQPNNSEIPNNKNVQKVKIFKNHTHILERYLFLLRIVHT